ncbi:GntR family transcriptional regulator [Nocardia rhamnosiphila]|uniref:GntR family transcriptional regulator n=1 Tax=Nocardia rhamnosiphila TaxID=426716 RepID=UPI0033C6CBDA
MGGTGHNDAAVDSVYQLVRDRILRGELEPGLRISSVKLAESLGVSRTPLREALRLLEREGLVTGERNRMLHVAEVSLYDLDDLYSLRISVEAGAVAQTVPHMSADDIAELDKLAGDMADRAEHRDVPGWRELDRRFHRALCAGAGPRTVRLIEDLRDHSNRYLRFYGSPEPQSWTTGKGEHERIVAACRSGEEWTAAVQLARHLAHTALTIFAVAMPEYPPRRIHEATKMVTERAPGPTSSRGRTGTASRPAIHRAG